MATSGSVDFTLTRDEIINDALVQIGAIEAGETPSAADTAFAAEAKQAYLGLKERVDRLTVS